MPTATAADAQPATRKRAPSLPSRIYAYPARIAKEDRDRCMDILFKAHQYRNQLVQFELERRKRVEGLLRELSEDLVKIDREIAEGEADKEAIYHTIRRKNSKQRERKVSKEDKARYEAAKKKLRLAYTQRKKIRGAIFKTDAFKEQAKVFEALKSAAVRKARSECGVYWGTYLQVEEARRKDHKGEPPQFCRFEKEGKLAVQFQKGALVDDVTNGQDTRLRISFDGNAITSSKKNPWRSGQIRIGSDGAKPIWATFHVRLSRPLPPGARLKWAWLVARRVGTTIKWSFQVVCSQESWPEKPDRAKKGLVGIDVGWRARSNGDLRIAAWVGDDGKRGEVIIPAWRLQKHRHARSLESIRKRLFNEAMAKLTAWMRTATLPEWFKEETATIDQWKSMNRLARLILHWRDQRFAGDETIYEALDGGKLAWRLTDKHLMEWAAFERHQFQNWRKNHYRHVAKELGARYRTAHIESVDWQKIEELPDVLDESAEHERQRLKDYKRDASVSYFNDAVKMMVVNVDKVEAKHTTSTCYHCGGQCDWDHIILHHTCEHCGKRWDQDFNAAENILRKATA